MRLHYGSEVIEMPMMYRYSSIPESKIPAATSPVFQHLVDIHASETNKVISVWRGFSDDDLNFRPHSRSGTVQEQMQHQMLSDRRFFGEFLGFLEPSKFLPAQQTVSGFVAKMQELAAAKGEALEGMTLEQMDALWEQAKLAPGQQS